MTDDDAELAREAMTLDPTKSSIVLFCGTKGRGKSAAARVVFNEWPTDRVVVDPTGDARPDDPATIAMTAPFPSQIPEQFDDDGNRLRTTVWARVDPHSPTLTFDVNQATKMAMYPRRRPKLLWRDEYGIGTTPQQAKGTEADRALVMSSRHFHITALLCLPRPLFVPKLALSQADLIGIWKLPNPEDRELIAKNAGISVPLFERVYAANQRRGRHAYMLFSRDLDMLLDCPPLPNIVPTGPKS